MRQLKLDNIHWLRHKLLSYKKTFNIAISPREPGKTTQECDLMYSVWKKGGCCIVIRRLITDISEVYIADIEKIYIKFGVTNLRFYYKKGDIAKGIVDVYATDDVITEPKLFFRLVALSSPLQRNKSLLLFNLKYIIYDEFMVNTTTGEKYLLNEVFRFKEIFNTYQRENRKLRAIFFGNPYSLYNPFFMWLKIPIKQIYPGAMLTGNNWALEVIELTKELKEYILAHNPLYSFDDSYTRYAFDGRAINDANIRVVETQPNNFKLRHIFKYGEDLIGAYVWSPDYSNLNVEQISKHYNDPNTIDYWVGTLPKEYETNRRLIAAFNVNDLIDGTYLVGYQERKLFDGLATAFRFRRIGYKSIAEHYAIAAVVNM